MIFVMARRLRVFGYPWNPKKGGQLLLLNYESDSIIPKNYFRDDLTTIETWKVLSHPQKRTTSKVSKGVINQFKGMGGSATPPP
jgi:hypothetical protein